MFPFGLAGILPKVNWVIRISFKELSKILYYSNELYLIGMRRWIKYLLDQIDSISNDYNMRNFCDINGLIDFTILIVNNSAFVVVMLIAW